MEKFPQSNFNSPLDAIGSEITDEERTALLDAIEKRAEEKSEDDHSSSLPSDDIEYFLGNFWD